MQACMYTNITYDLFPFPSTRRRRRRARVGAASDNIEMESEYEEDTETEDAEEDEEPKTARQISVEIPPNAEAPKRYGNEFKFEAHDRFADDGGLAEVEV